MLNELLGNKSKTIESKLINLKKITIIDLFFLYYYYCVGVKPGPMRWAQEQRFINNTPEEKKS